MVIFLLGADIGSHLMQRKKEGRRGIDVRLLLHVGIASLLGHFSAPGSWSSITSRQLVSNRQPEGLHLIRR
jgi:hypothetical protein